MKMLIIIYAGTAADRIEALLDRHHAGGYTVFHSAAGAGESGKRGSSAGGSTGTATLFMSIVPIDRVEQILVAVRQERRSLAEGERLHAAVIPTDAFF